MAYYPQRARGQHQELAGWGQRCGAALIDLLVTAVPAAAVFWLLSRWSLTRGHFAIHVTYSAGYGEPHVIGLNPFGLIVWLLLLASAWGLLMGRHGYANGETIGRGVIGIRVVADDGRELSGRRAGTRFLIEALLLGLFVVPGLIDALWVLIDSENRALHDIACRTHVVRTGRGLRG